MKTSQIKQVLLGLILSAVTPSLLLAADSEKGFRTTKQGYVVNGSFDKDSQDKSKPADLKQLFDTRVLEQNLIKGAIRLRTGGNSGGGGDEVGLEFKKIMLNALENLKINMPGTYTDLYKFDLKSLADEVKVIVVDDALDVGIKDYIQNSVAVNLPESKVILLNRSRWTAINDNKLREAIALHEILSLRRLESTGNYSISGKYLSAQSAAQRDFVNAVRVDRDLQIAALITQVPITSYGCIIRYVDEAIIQLANEKAQEHQQLLLMDPPTDRNLMSRRSEAIAREMRARYYGEELTFPEVEKAMEHDNQWSKELDRSPVEEHDAINMKYYPKFAQKCPKVK